MEGKAMLRVGTSLHVDHRYHDDGSCCSSRRLAPHQRRRNLNRRVCVSSTASK